MLIAMSWYHEKEKEFILECLGTPGFRDVFMCEVSSNRPLIWNGYKIARYFNHDQRDFQGIPFLTAKLMQLAKTFRFPKNPIHEAALYFFVQRWCFRDVWMDCYPESPVDETIDSDSFLGQWSICFLMYLDSLTWHFPEGFKMEPQLAREAEAPRAKYIFREVCRQLCGARSDTARVFPFRAGSETEYRNICSHCAKKHWAARFHNAEKHPALVLALSFYANGFASFKTESNHKPDADSLNADYLYDLVNRTTDYKVFIPEEDWEARAVFFILAQWLFLSDRRITEPTLEEHIFAILYLRFYRQGADEYFKRESMSAIWDGIPYDKKEDVAVYYRRLLADTRNKAAELWPDARISDYPEIAEDGIAIGRVFQELVRDEQYDKLDILISKHSRILRPCWESELLWAASHCKKKVYSYLQQHQPESTESRGGKESGNQLIDMIIDGWSKLSVDELIWSNGAIKQLLSPALYQWLITCASRHMFSYVMPYGEPGQLARLKVYVETLKFDPNIGDTGEYQYNASHPPLYRFIEHQSTESEESVAYLLEHGANPNCGGHRCTCLGLAVAGNRLRLMKMLIDSGADVNLPSTTGRTPVEVAIDHKRAKALELLINAGAQPIVLEDSYFNGEHGIYWLKQSEQIRNFLGIDGGRMVKVENIDWPLFRRS